MDFFCDYFQTPLDSEGHRYYIRQHQLRRFFAMLFFWGSAFGGMDTLRWFLGHRDISHLYHYITESIPGDVLRAVKANFAGHVLKRSRRSKRISGLVQKHFGTDNFSVLDSDELDEYVEELMSEGRVEIEPEFFEASEGNTYRILIKVTPARGNGMIVDKRVERNTQSVFALRELLRDTLQTPATYLENNELQNALKSQGALSKYSDESRGI